MKPNVWLYLILLFAAMSGYLVWQRVRHSSVPAHASGIWVYLSRSCGKYEIDDDRTVVLQLHANGDIYLNMDRITQQELPSLLAQIFEARAERVLRITADDDVSYGRAVGIISDIKARVPRLAIVVLPRGTPEFVMTHWCVSSADIVPEDR